MKYYFLTSNTKSEGQAFVIGPFISVINTSEKYFGQIIRSNDYSDYLSDIPFGFNLWSINSDETSLERVKYWIHTNLSKLSSNSSVTLIGKFQGPINQSKTKLEFITQLNIKYILEFRINENMLYCPNLTIEY